MECARLKAWEGGSGFLGTRSIISSSWISSQETNLGERGHCIESALRSEQPSKLEHDENEVADDNWKLNRSPPAAQRSDCSFKSREFPVRRGRFLFWHSGFCPARDRHASSLHVQPSAALYFSTRPGRGCPCTTLFGPDLLLIIANEIR